MVGKRWSFRARAVIAVVAIVGCEDFGQPSDGNPTGDLGYADFRWRCGGDGDLACLLRGQYVRDVALGGVFQLSYGLVNRVPSEVDSGPIELAGRNRARARGSDRFEALESGPVTLIAVSQNDEVIDFTTLQIEPIDDLRLRPADSQPFPELCPEFDEFGNPSSCDPGSVNPGSLEFRTGRDVEVRVEPLGFAGQELMGQLGYTWSVAPIEVASLLEADGHEAVIRVEGNGVLEVTVTVTGGLSRTFHYRTVSTGSNGPRRTKPGEDDSGSSGTEGDSGDSDDSGSGSDTGGFETDTDGDTETDSATDGANSTGGGR